VLLVLPLLLVPLPLLLLLLVLLLPLLLLLLLLVLLPPLLLALLVAVLLSELLPPPQADRREIITNMWQRVMLRIGDSIVPMRTRVPHAWPEDQLSDFTDITHSARCRASTRGDWPAAQRHSRDTGAFLSLILARDARRNR
jgi:hypothetical protein